MALVPLKLPPGISRPGTKYDSRGRWYDCNLIRWVEGVMQAWGGWTALKDGANADVTVSAAPRGMLAWRANDGTAHLGIGTAAKLWHWTGTTLTDITPATFTVGNASWQIDAFGEDLIACADVDGQILLWDKSVGGAAAALTNAPVNCRGVVVTAERFIVALGAAGDARLVQWCDQEAPTVWAPSDTNQAGDFPLQTPGKLLAGRPGRGETLLWTDIDLWSMRYIGGELIYSFNRAGDKCGAVSARAMAVVDGKAFWMGRRSFFSYDGFVQPLPSDVSDYVFSSLSTANASKIWCEVRSDFGEVIWYYPSASASECDRYVVHNYREGWWAIGTLERTAGVDRGVFGESYLADAAGKIYRHETGSAYVNPAGATLTPNAESGPVDIGDGRVITVLQLVPDEKTLGDAKVRMYSSMYPTSAETDHGLFTLTAPTDMRFTGRQVRVKVEQVNAGWRWGTPRFDVVPGGYR